jgi:hypothetical protein
MRVRIDMGVAVAGVLAGCWVAWGGVGVAAQQAAARKITADEVKVFINGHAGVDECESLDQIHIDYLEYFDFTGDGQEEAVVVASTCMTGTAGPDIHAVYTREADGGLAELPFLDGRGDPPIDDFKGQGFEVQADALQAHEGPSGRRAECGCLRMGWWFESSAA